MIIRAERCYTVTAGKEQEKIREVKVGGEWELQKTSGEKTKTQKGRKGCRRKGDRRGQEMDVKAKTKGK